MLQERYRAWSPLEGVPHEVWVEAIHDDYEGFRVLLKGDGNARTLRLTFVAPVAFRNINESFRARTWSDRPAHLGLPSLRLVDRSRWLDWLIEESGGILDAGKLKHYAIYTPEDCIDVVTEFEPAADWLNK